MPVALRRRALLQTAGAGAAAWLLGACASRQTGSTTPPPPLTTAEPSAVARPAPASPTPVSSLLPVASPSPVVSASPPLGYVFNTIGQDVTIFDVVSRQVVGTRPLGATVTWLSNEQRFWDGHSIWTYDYPDNQVRAIAIDPRTVSIAHMIPTGGKGPAHSLMLTPDLRSAWVNVAGEDFLAVLDVGSAQLVEQVKTGKFP